MRLRIEVREERGAFRTGVRKALEVGVRCSGSAALAVDDYGPA